jgi:hypothetical protein
MQAGTANHLYVPSDGTTSVPVTVTVTVTVLFIKGDQQK